MQDELPSIRQAFPQFLIWREITGERTRYIARRRNPPTRPHTVVTSDLQELCAALAPARALRPPQGTVPEESA